MICPICGSAASGLCTLCGFDISADMEFYPTLMPVTGDIRSKNSFRISKFTELFTLREALSERMERCEQLNGRLEAALTELEGKVTDLSAQFGELKKGLEAKPTEPTDGTGKASDGTDEALFRPGDIFAFGEYPQSSLDLGKKDPIEWIVLNNDGQSVLLISKLILDWREFDRSGKTGSWSACSLRQWLNSDFLNRAFDDRQKKQLLSVGLRDAGTQEKLRDKVVLLSAAMLKKYSDILKMHECEPTAYVRKNKGNCYIWWWCIGAGSTAESAAYVCPETGSTESTCSNYARGVRPCIVIRADAG